jgi:hypothetical protein
MSSAHICYLILSIQTAASHSDMKNVFLIKKLKLINSTFSPVIDAAVSHIKLSSSRVILCFFCFIFTLMVNDQNFLLNLFCTEVIVGSSNCRELKIIHEYRQICVQLRILYSEKVKLKINASSRDTTVKSALNVSSYIVMYVACVHIKT